MVGQNKNNGIRARNTPLTFRGNILAATPQHLSGAIKELQRVS